MAGKRIRKRRFVHEHSLSIATTGVLVLWICLYGVSNPSTHLGAFFGNAIADWSGVVLMVFLLLTGIGWLTLYVTMDSNAKWGQVVGNILSEWTQVFVLVLLTKRLIERHSKESAGDR